MFIQSRRFFQSESSLKKLFAAMENTLVNQLGDVQF